VKTSEVTGKRERMVMFRSGRCKRMVMFGSGRCNPDQTGHIICAQEAASLKKKISRIRENLKGVLVIKTKKPPAIQGVGNVAQHRMLAQPVQGLGLNPRTVRGNPTLQKHGDPTKPESPLSLPHHTYPPPSLDKSSVCHVLPFQNVKIGQ
jgi:hypothetical protein